MADFAIRIGKFKQLTEKEVFENDWDQLPALTTYERTVEFCDYLEDHRDQLEKIISRHLRIPPTEFVLLKTDVGFWGSFNLVCLIEIHSPSRAEKLPKLAVLRFPLPWRCGEEYNPGNAEEKLRCEAATYVWLQQNCPNIRIPRLLGVGFPGNEAFTPVDQEPLWHRLVWQIRRCRAWFRGETLSPLFRHDRVDSLSDHGYLLIEFIQQGEMLSSSWQDHHEDEARRRNLFRGLSRILLDFAKVPLPRIGSWTMDGRGVISLTNRPLLDLTMIWERHGIPTGMPRSLTYTSAYSYGRDVLELQSNRMRFQRNAIFSRQDGLNQLSALTALRALYPVFWQNNPQSNKFVFTLPDLHQSNIFVDKDWNVTALIDFEFSPVQPEGMVEVPHWISNISIDDMHGPALEVHRKGYDVFIDILEEEEANRQQGHELSSRLKEDWRSGKMWFNACLGSCNAFPFLFDNNIHPQFSLKLNAEREVKGEEVKKTNEAQEKRIEEKEVRVSEVKENEVKKNEVKQTEAKTEEATEGKEDEEAKKKEAKDDEKVLTLAQYWGKGLEDFIAAKLKDNDQYREDVRAIFAAARQKQLGYGSAEA